MPESTEARETGSRAGCGPRGMLAAQAAAAQRPTMAMAKTTSAPKESSSPPSAGPQICAVWLALADQALARGTRTRGTSPGSRAAKVGASTARAAPISAMVP